VELPKIKEEEEEEEEESHSQRCFIGTTTAANGLE
jgi:hypothetical protein